MSEPVTADVLLRKAERALARGEIARAENAWQRALALDAGHPEALFHLGNRDRERGEHAAAVARYELALVRAPRHPAVLNNLGLALESIGEFDRAEARYREVLAVDPQHADALLNLAHLCFRTSRFAEAADTHAKAAAIRRELPAAVWVQRALAQEKVRDLAGAEASLREAARVAPGDARIQINLATLYLRQRRHVDAEEPLSRALALDRDNPYALSTLAYVRQQRCAWQGLDELHRRIGRLLDEEEAAREPFNPFPLLAMPTTPRQRLVAARRWARVFAQPAAAKAAAVTRASGERLRVGFVSSDFRPHPTTSLLLEVWERIDRERLETFAYGIEPTDSGAIGERIRRAFDHCVDLSSEPDARIARRIRDDRIHVLIDLNGYTRLAREAIFALRPAPLQVNALGYLGTLGADWYDYLLSDNFATPPEAQAHFSERLLTLDDCYCPSDTKREVAAERATRAAHGLPAQGFVFCCYNNAYKILPDVFAVWMRLLGSVAGSVLWLTETGSDTAENLRREARAAGIDPSRVVFAPRLPLAQHLARHAHADLFLDTTPYNAGATANDALFMGLPLVTCAGDTMSSRVAGSQLRAHGLPELVTSSLQEYETLARSLAADPERLSAYRERVANRATHRLFDMARYTRSFENALERLWRDYAGKAPV